ncbi:MAG: GTP-binding protein [Coriobacteriales bacterium]|jgi:G3E family GTPase|nr:GTP-binding protein [Coriobacteriales bacterium]
MNAIILSGFLGAGKTSLLLQLAAYLTATTPGDKEVKVAVIENEIGSVSVDGTTLKGQGVEVREIMSGCVCCSLAGELATSIRVMQWQFDPDWLVVEATGLAYPEKAADSVREGAVRLGTCTVVVLIDAERFLQLERISPLIAGQPKHADIILLNKVDLVDDEQRNAVRQRLEKINPTATIIEISASQPLAVEVFEEMTHHA